MIRPLPIFLLAAMLPSVLAKSSGQAASGAVPLPTFRTQTELVTVPVVVTDKSGKHITGLKQSDFTLEENGSRREISHFEEISPTSEAYRVPDKVAREYSNFIPTDANVRRTSIIVIDLLNTPFRHQAQTRKEIISYLSKHVEDNGPTSLCILDGNGLKQIHSFTSNTSVLIDALKLVNGKLSSQDLQAAGNLVNPDSPHPFDDATADINVADTSTQLLEVMAERVDADYAAYDQRLNTQKTLKALEQIGQAYAGIPGRKALLWATGGFPFFLNDPRSVIGIDSSLMQNYERTWQILNAANIALYPIDSQGLLPPDTSQRGFASSRTSVASRGSSLAPNRPTRLPIDARTNIEDSLRTFAAATGGQACLNTNDLANCFAKAATDSSQYYLLSYYLSQNDRKPGWRKLKVHVAVSSVEIRARDGFFIGDTKQHSEGSLKEQLDTAAVSPIDYTSIPLAIQLKEITKAANGDHNVSFTLLAQSGALTIDIADNNHVYVDIGAVVENGKGQLARVLGQTIDAHIKPDNIAKVMKEGVSFTSDLVVPAGKATLLRFVVRDGQSGKMGSVTVPIHLE
ncbi:hypothetical protein Acid345_2179 [Candidatus Koribacter versatilis Ellin345]|uniref:VWFA-related domain-containing protein n=1 Tax=Koribacter versatilis (strain Ellin345) TaxID=204669 RepID=Q1IPM0_KORVE|nr:VWA domain-containing protein [Candidatus Koribacter versatilis]ABF41180.1 hypothetical protein Acid345_2179 [Candidatus Koribacter versatilis Ellin345]